MRPRSNGGVLQTKVIFFFYRAALVAAFPLLLLYVGWRAARDRRYLFQLQERFGFWSLREGTPPGSVWLHAVSVGEVLSAMDLLRRIRAELPHTAVYVSCSTLAGREVADAKLGTLADGVFYVPVDMPFAVRRVLRLVRPAVVVVLETEIWPILYREARRAAASVVIVNGRISDKAAPKYARHRWFFRAAFESVNAILAQSAQDRDRFLAAGAPADRVCVNGNLKYDFQPQPGSVPSEVTGSLRRPLWIAASTTGPVYEGDVDEDDLVIAAHIEVRRRFPEAQLLVAPRKPERFDAVEKKLKAAGLPYARRSRMQDGETASVILLDSIGELGGLFPFGDVVFMGGTLADRGGHNILEPALCGKPVVAGPHLENFAAIRDRFRAGDGYVSITAPELAEAVGALLADPARREILGDRAKALAEAERGATGRALRVIADKRWAYVPAALPWGPARPLLWVLAKMWTAGGRVKRALARPRALRTPVISIGGIAMGGVGKTPMARYLAEALQSKGYRPAVLTRGYGREAREVVCLAKGSQAPVSLTGDEAQLLLRSCDVGIGSDRWAAGVAMEKEFNPDVFLLDDGFQHARLKRNVDVVLLDAFDPLAGDAAFPLGRLREDVNALRRADVIVISRAGQRRFDGLRQRLPAVPLFLADVELAGWRPEPPAGPVAAFCGLANPATFYATLRESGAEVVLTKNFPDHHRFTRDELTRLSAAAKARGAQALVTTEKDWVNLPEGSNKLVAPLTLHRLEILTRVREEHLFIEMLAKFVMQH